MMIRYLLRGGSCGNDARGLRCLDRYWIQPESRGWYFGFRLIVRREA